MGLLALINRNLKADESEGLKRRRRKAAYWAHRLSGACEDKELSGVIEGDTFWQAILYAMLYGREATILELYKDQGALAAHGQTDYFKDLGRKMGPTMAGPPSVEYLDSVG